MKVLLIQPPEFHMITTNVPSVVDEESGAYPPLGLLYVAAYLEKNTNHTVEILDTILEHLNYEQIEDEIRRRKPDLVGIQAMTFTLIDATLTAQAVKRVDRTIPVVFGGPHVYIYPHETMKIPEVDYIVVGEGNTVCPAGGNAGRRETWRRWHQYQYRDKGNRFPPGPLNTISTTCPCRPPSVPQDRHTGIAMSPITTMMTSHA